MVLQPVTNTPNNGFQATSAPPRLNPNVMRVYMNRYIKLGIAVVFAAAVGFGGGFWFGAYVGLEQFFLMDSAPKASILAGQLRALRAGKTNPIIEAKEVELDGEIVKHFRFLEEGHPWIFWPFNHSFDNDQYMRAVAAYRKEHPSITPALNFGDDKAFKSEMEDYVSEVSKANRELIEKYGK